jgi:hypothetical protein
MLIISSDKSEFKTEASAGSFSIINYQLSIVNLLSPQAIFNFQFNNHVNQLNQINQSSRQFVSKTFQMMIEKGRKRGVGGEKTEHKNVSLDILSL